MRDSVFVRLSRQLAVILLVAFGALAPGDGIAEDEGTVVAEKPVAEVLQAHSRQLLSLPGVVGVGEGRCGEAPCILVLVVEKTPALEAEIGKVLQGYPVNIVASGEILAREPQ